MYLKFKFFVNVHSKCKYFSNSNKFNCRKTLINIYILVFAHEDYIS